MVYTRDGTLETVLGAQTNIVTTGGIIFEASNEPHGLRNVGTTPATYYVFRFSPQMADQRP